MVLSECVRLPEQISEAQRDRILRTEAGNRMMIIECVYDVAAAAAAAPGDNRVRCLARRWTT